MKWRHLASKNRLAFLVIMNNVSLLDIYIRNGIKQAQLSHRGCVMLRVIEYFAK